MSELHPAIGKMLEKYDLSTADKTYEALGKFMPYSAVIGVADPKEETGTIWFGILPMATK